MKYSIDIEFTPTLENAPDLLMDVAALLSTVKQAEPRPEADHSQCVSKEQHEAQIYKQRQESAEARDLLIATDRVHIEELTAQLARVTAERDQLIANAEKMAEAGAKRTRSLNRKGWALPRVGEMVKLMPHSGHEGWTTGVVKAIHGRGGRDGIEVMPKGHGRTEIISHKYLKRFAENERRDEVAA